MKRKAKLPPEVESVLKFISENQRLSGFSGKITPELEGHVLELWKQGKLKRRKPILNKKAWLERRRVMNALTPRKVANWLRRPNPRFGGASPIELICNTGSTGARRVTYELEQLELGTETAAKKILKRSGDSRPSRRHA
jgi:hypothetical protein